MPFLFFAHDPKIFKNKHVFKPSDSECSDFTQRIHANNIEHILLSAKFSKNPLGPSVLTCSLSIDAKIQLTCLLSKEDVPFAYKQTYSLFFYTSAPNNQDPESDFEEHLEMNNGQIDLWELSQQYIILEAPMRPIAQSHKADIQNATSTKHESKNPFSKLKDLI